MRRSTKYPPTVWTPTEFSPTNEENNKISSDSLDSDRIFPDKWRKGVLMINSPVKEQELMVCLQNAKWASLLVSFIFIPPIWNHETVHYQYVCGEIMTKTSVRDFCLFFPFLKWEFGGRPCDLLRMTCQRQTFFDEVSPLKTLISKKKPDVTTVRGT